MQKISTEDHAAPVVGLTGNIGSGKSTVAEIFRTLGVFVLDADDLAKQIVHPGGQALQKISDEFGKQVLQADGALDRAKLAEVVFSNTLQRKKLEAITHPLIAEKSEKILSQIKASEYPYSIYEATLLVETKREQDFDALLVVCVSEQNQHSRLSQRGLSSQDIAARIRAQMPCQDKAKIADFVIHNDGSFDELRSKVLQTHEAISKKFDL